MALELLRENTVQLFNKEFGHDYNVYNHWGKEMQNFIWLLSHTSFEVELPIIQYLLEMLEQNPGLPSRTIQMLASLFFIALNFRLHARRYFQPRGEATEVLRKEAWEIVMDRMEYLVEVRSIKLCGF